MFDARKKLDKQVDLCLEAIIDKRQGRHGMIEMLVNIESSKHFLGSRDNWDIKDSLWRHINCPDDAEDVLARRYWAKATMERLHRARAIKMWDSIRRGDRVSRLEELLSAFDMFVDGVEDANGQDASAMLDDLAVKFEQESPHRSDWNTRDTARELAMFLRRQSFRGVQDHSTYHNLPNNFLLRALKDSDLGFGSLKADRHVDCQQCLEFCKHWIAGLSGLQCPCCFHHIGSYGTGANEECASLCIVETCVLTYTAQHRVEYY